MRRYLIIIIGSLANISQLFSQPLTLQSFHRVVTPTIVELGTDGAALVKVNAAPQRRDISLRFALVSYVERDCAWGVRRVTRRSI